MDIYSMMDEKSKQNLKKIMDGNGFNNVKTPVKKKEKKQVNPKEDSEIEHLEEYHFKTGDEFITHIKRRKKAFRGSDYGWITIDDKDPDMVVSYQRNETTGKMELKCERFEAFKGYVQFLESSKTNGYIEFWHKKSHKKDHGDSDSDNN